jgi:hypothetical protein
MIYFLILLPIAAIITWLVRKERSRRVQTQKNEEEFLAAMRANPLAKSAPLEARAEAPMVPIHPGPASSAPVLPIVLPATGGASPTPVPPIEVSSSRVAVPDITPRAAPSAPLAAPRDGRCMVCGEAVDVRASDQSRWGVKIPEPGTERLIWVHFHCLAIRLAEGQQLRGALTTLVGALDTGDEPGPGHASAIAEALKRARQTLGQ